MKNKFLCLLLLTALATTAFAQEDEKKDKLIKTKFAIDDKHPMVVVDQVPYCLFGLTDPRGRPYYAFQVTDATRKSLNWLYFAKFNASTLRFCWKIPNKDGNAPLTNCIFVSVSKNDGRQNVSLDPKLDASKFVHRIEKELKYRDEHEEVHCRYEYIENNQPTGKFLGFADTESDVASIDKSFKPRKMILCTKEKSALFVHVTAFNTSGK